MCGRYYVDETMFQEVEHLLQALGAGERSAPRQEDRAGDGMAAGQLQMGDIHPGDLAPVLVHTMDGICLQWQHWGLPRPEQASGGRKGLVFNARSESALEKRMFRDGVLYRRAVIPARWFYEWNRAREKITFFQEEEPVLYLAGFFNWYQDGPHFVILTAEANESMKKTHDRMPLIFTKEEAVMWLKEQKSTEQLLKKRPAALQKKAEFEQISFF